MARLLVFHEGRRIKDCDLQSGKEWIVGRASSADIVLEGDRGISRQHFKIISNNGRWKLEVLSRYGELYHNGDKVTSMDLSNACRFEIPPYEFVFEDEIQTHEGAAQSPEQTPVMDFSERTSVGHIAILPYLRLVNSYGENLQVFRLEGHNWVVGRDMSCAIYIDNPKFSRRHFEIRSQEGAYLVKDLGSSNGTLLNGEPISTTDWSVLKSGDALTVVDDHLHFELRDSNFDQKLQEISPELRSSLMTTTEAPAEHVPLYPQPQSIPPAAGPLPLLQFHLQNLKKKNNWVRTVVGVLVVFGLVAYLLDDGDSSGVSAKKITSSPFEKLTPQQQQYVKDTYRLADRLFKEGRYEMSRQEVAKIHELIPIYQESKNLEKLADAAIQSQIELQKAEVREREKLEMEEKIQTVLAQCKTLITPNVDAQKIEDCLAPIVPLNPEHPDILAMNAQVDKLAAERIERNQKAATYASQVRKQKGLFSKASALEKEGKPLEALALYEQVAVSRLPDPENLKSQAKRNIASIQQTLTSKQAEYEKEAEAATKKGDLKSAVTLLKQALAINPQNETLKGRVNSTVNELKKQMQNLYQEGVLEESVGEVEAAKVKWKKILEMSVPEEDYYKKAKSKLKKYETL